MFDPQDKAVPGRTALAGVLALVLLAAPMAWLLQTSIEHINRIEREQAGLEPAWQSIQLLRVTQLHRGISAGVLSGMVQLHADRIATGRKLRDRLNSAHLSLAGYSTDLSASMERIIGPADQLVRSIDTGAIEPETRFRQHTALITAQLALLREISDQSMILNTDITEPRLQIAAFQELPEVAEALGLIDQLTDILIPQALEVFSRVDGLANSNLAINVSAFSLVDLQMPDRIAGYAAAAGIPMSRLTVEITESGLIKEFAKVLDVLARLRLRGAGISIDDFGTGYSSLAKR